MFPQKGAPSEEQFTIKVWPQGCDYVAIKSDKKYCCNMIFRVRYWSAKGLSVGLHAYMESIALFLER